MPENFWERAMVVGAFAIAAAFLLLLGKREFFDSDASSPNESVAAPISTPEGGALLADGFSDVAGAERSDAEADSSSSGQPGGRTVRPTPTRADRLDCAALRNVHDRTRSERVWYIDNCMFVKRNAGLPGQAGSANADVEALLQAAGFSLEDPSTRRSAGQAGALPPDNLTSADAVALAVDWIPDNTPVTVSVASGDCTPVWLNGHWVVTCDVAFDGCTVAPCAATLAVCVFADDPVVVPDLLC
jgi:hypothetical protein